MATGCTAEDELAGRSPGPCTFFKMERRRLVGDLFHYSFKLRVGDGEHDFITVHRVLRERAPGVPISTSHALFMVHGDLWGFDAAFAGGRGASQARRPESIATFLASRDVDVWGIDLRWASVSAGLTDFTFMKDWTIGTHVSDLRAALAAARLVRGRTGSGLGQLALLGWSSGGILAYAYANDETRYPASLRHVDALIPVDIAFKLGAEHEEQRLGACQRYLATKPLLDSGVYHSSGEGVQAIGLLASTAPEELSPFFPGLTNRQGALLIGAATYLGFDQPPTPYYHFTAGVFDDMGLPVSLQFTPESDLFDFFQAAAPTQSFTEIVEREALVCDEIDVPYDDRLDRIRIPVLYVGAEGGFGRFGTDTLALLGSRDVSSHIVQLYPYDSQAVEFGHSDLFMADNARGLVWTPIYRWLMRH